MRIIHCTGLEVRAGLLVLIAGIGVAQAQEPKVRVLIAGDTSPLAWGGNPAVTELVATDKSRIERLFVENVAPEQLDLVVVPENEVSPAGIRAALQRMLIGIGPADALVTYYSGHGFVDRNTSEYYFRICDPDPTPEAKIRSSDVAHRELLELVNRNPTQPRHFILLTDCCANFAAPRPRIEERDADKPDSVPQAVRPQKTSRLFSFLLFGYKGITRLTSSQPGQFSLFRKDDEGSLFTFALEKALRQAREVRVGWPEICRRVRHEVDVDYRQFYPEGVRGQITQTVHQLGLGRGPVFGALIVTREGGATVAEVVPGTPAHLSGIQVGEVIISINGRIIRTQDDYGAAVDLSGREMTLVVQRSDGSPREVSIILEK